MKLLIITQKVDRNDPILGFFHRWIEEFAKQCASVIVVCLEEGTHSLPKNVRVLSLGKERHGTHGFETVRYIVQFYKIIIRERGSYDAVFVHMNPIYVVLGGVLWRLWGKKIGLWYAHKNVDMKLRVATFLAHDIFTPSEKSFRLRAKKRHILGHGIDVDSFSPVREDDSLSTVLTVGRISAVKNYGILVDAVRILKERWAACQVQISGVAVTEKDRAYEQTLRNTVHAADLDREIGFTGALSREEVAKSLRKALVFVNTSRTGSLDKAVLEAMAAGVPVLTSNEAFADVLGADADTLMFRDANELAQKIVHIRDMSGEERHALAARLRRIIVEEHDVCTLIPRILTFYATGK